MDSTDILEGKRVLVVDDEGDVLDSIIDLLDKCAVDTASSFEEAREMLELDHYDAAILDIMGVKGYELLDICKKQNIPALMLTANAVSVTHLKRSVEGGAASYVPKDEIAKVDLFLADILEAIENDENTWLKWYSRLSKFADKKFGPGWAKKDSNFWDSIIKY